MKPKFELVPVDRILEMVSEAPDRGLTTPAHGIYSSPVGGVTASRRIFPWIAVLAIALCGGAGFLLARSAWRSKPAPPAPSPQPVAESVMRRTSRALYLYHVRKTWAWDEIVKHCASCPSPEALYAEYLENRNRDEFVSRCFDFGAQEGLEGHEAPLAPHDFFAKIVPFGDAAFHVHVAERDGSSLRVRVVVFQSKEYHVVERWLRLDDSAYAPPAAIVVGGSIEIHGHPEAPGLAANGDVRIYGSVGFPIRGRAAADLPDFDVRDYAEHADFRMDARGLVHDRSGTVLRAQPDRRIVDGEGTWFVEGDAVLDDRAPSRVTVFATGSVTVDGPRALAAAADGLLVAAMGDVLVRGRPGSRFRGSLVAGEQVKLVGQAEIEGAVIACHRANLHGLFDGPDSMIGGGTRIVAGEVPGLRASSRLK